MFPGQNGLFHRKLLRQALERHGDLAQIDGVQEKLAILRNWRQAIESASLKKSGEVALHGDFLLGIFGQVLGYYGQIEHPAEWQLAHEQKTLTDATKSDGALGFFTPDAQDIRAIIELKSIRTDLDAKQHRKDDKRSPVEQAFGYVHKAGGNCRWVIVSNYQEIRLYHASFSGKYEVFQVADLANEPEFRRFYALLAREHLFVKTGESRTEALYRQSLETEQAITGQFYAQYTQARHDVFGHLKQQNPERDALALLTHTQQLLDRFIFICFCEDTGDLLPEKTFRKLIQRTQESLTLDDQYGAQKIWAEVKTFFKALNEGRSSHRIPGFNGELFKPDPDFDELRIEDPIFLKLAQLTEYDFQSDLNVNILGHIFEQSLTDLEEMRAEIRGEQTDRKQSKRKKEGIFYTPEYITRYIVEQAIGGWLDDRQRELGRDALPELTPDDDDWLNSNAKKKKPNPRVAQHIAFYEAYLERLKQITVLDPACGSGAFLTQAFDYLLREGERVNRELNRLRSGEQLGLFSRKTWDKAILRNNLFGVDLNAESVEITKLALWLKTAKKDDQLTALNQNIKCGNSLIDDPAAAGDKAFRWEQEFPEIVQRGGFDVVIGNPPYGATLQDRQQIYIESHCRCFQKNFDIYTAFIEFAFTKLGPNGYWGYIMPVSWQSGDNYIQVRQYLKDVGVLKIGIKLPYDVFSEAYIDTGIYIFQKTYSQCYISKVYEFPTRYDVSLGFESKINFSHLPNTFWQNTPSLKITLKPSYYELLPKMNMTTVKLGDISVSIRGVLPNDSDVHDIQADNLKKYFIGNLYRYQITEEFKWLAYGDNLRERPKEVSYFQGERILIRRLISRQFRLMAMYVVDEFVNKKDLYNIKLIDPRFHAKYILAIVNSQLISYLKTKGSTTATKDDFSQLTLADIRDIPIKHISLQEQQSFVEKVDMMLELNQRLHADAQKFLRFLEASYHPKNISTKLETFYTLSFAEFLAELGKQGVKLAKPAEFELMGLFDAQAAPLAACKQQIDATDRDIDQIVYQLYGLTAEEIESIENS